MRDKVEAQNQHEEIANRKEKKLGGHIGGQIPKEVSENRSKGNEGKDFIK